MAWTQALIARFALLALLSVTWVGGLPSVVRAADPISEQEAHAISVAAYVYLYPLVTME